MTKTAAFQGTFGAYSDLACRSALPDHKTLPCLSFDDMFAAVRDGGADVAMLPVENSVAGRVADAYNLLPQGELHIIGEHYQPVVHHLLAVKGAKIEDIKEAHSHVQALTQCRNWLLGRKIKPVVDVDTALAAEKIAASGDKSAAAVASELAAEIYGLQSLASDIADLRRNTTRFLILARSPMIPPAGTANCVTTIIFRVRSVPAALYKALGGFATNGLNITKLESYLVDGSFMAAQFYMDVEGHPQDASMRHAMEELGFFAHETSVLGVYPAHEFRRKAKRSAEE